MVTLYTIDSWINGLFMILTLESFNIVTDNKQQYCKLWKCQAQVIIGSIDRRLQQFVEYCYRDSSSNQCCTQNATLFNKWVGDAKVSDCQARLFWFPYKFRKLHLKHPTRSDRHYDSWQIEQRCWQPVHLHLYWLCSDTYITCLPVSKFSRFQSSWRWNRLSW